MKLLVFSPYYPPHIGGLESHADEFNKYLSQQRVDISVFTPRLPQDAQETEVWHNNVYPVKSGEAGAARREFNGVKIIRFPAFEIIPNYPLPRFWNFRFWQLFFSLFRDNFDIIISRTRFFNTSLLALVYSKIKNKPWLHIEHGSDYVKLHSQFSSIIAKIYDHTLGWLVLKTCDELVTNSQASANFCRKIAGREAEIIHRGVEIEKIEEIQPNLSLKNKYPADIYITFIGRLIDGKGVADLLLAAKDLSGNFKIFIVGDGSQRSNLEELAQDLGITDKVIFFGHKSHEEAIGILKISDIFVNPSYTEGLPSSVIEAALCRKAIVATNVGGTPEIITGSHDGYLIDPKNINQLKERLEKLMSDEKLRAQFGENAYTEVIEKFAWEKSIGKYQDIFRKLGNSKRFVYFLSSRHGGPYRQHKIIMEEFKKRGYRVEHRSDFLGWIKAHFIYGKNRYIITNVPLLFRFSKKHFIFNIKGNYHKERHLWKNPLGYLYNLNKLWSEKIVLPSEYLRDILQIKDALIIKNAVSEKLITESQKEKPINTSNTANLIMVTMFGFREKAEGVLKVIECLSQVKTDKNITLNIFGSGSFEEEMKQRAALIKLPENIKVNFRGYAKSIEEEYRKADIFVYWSNLDVMPNVFLEAMAFGLPIIANNFESFSDVLPNWNVIANNSTEYTNKLQNFIVNPDLVNNVGKDNSSEIKKFSANSIMADWLKIIE